MKVRFSYGFRVAIIATFFAILYGQACRQKPARLQNQGTHEVKARAKPPSSFTDTLFIETPAAVFYYPDSVQVEKIKSLTDPQVFDGSIHEYHYLQKNARKAAKQFNSRLPIIDAQNVRFLIFLSKGQKDTCIDLDTRDDAFGMFIASPNKKPHPVDMANIDRELPAYFGN